MKTMVLALASAALVAGCGSNGREAAAERMEESAEANAATAGPAPVALGLSEAQLLDADLIGPGNVEIGEVKSLVRSASGAVEGLIVEVEDTNPDRFVQIPLTGLKVVQRGDDRDLSTTMTREQLAALPDVPLPVR
ncbi:PRC-barrel domain containing protein [Sphingomonas sp.]|jgi:hypothetical protein|uniref:PRC-barrel domain containing protein n=1 Tax=Sphingomonas sp. TaxID=28214 RepID=UPI00262DC50A|nr:PRC-barrel domain containing protein [Sphingomonas sp.]MDF2493731.1 hypothetical protein [Sphingomonas sp.]